MINNDLDKPSLLHAVNEIEQINTDIENLLVAILPNVAQDIQLELANLIAQINCVNQLIYKQQRKWLARGLKTTNNSSSELLFVLKTIRNLLSVIKTKEIELTTLQKIRIDIEKLLNSYKYPLGGLIANFLLGIYYSKSVPLKILFGLSITSLISIVALNFSVNEITSLYVNAPTLSNTTRSSSKPNLFLLVSQSSTDIRQNSSYNLQKHVYNSLIYAGSAGILGSVVSILLRIIQFQDQKYEDPLIPFFLGMFKPMIGLFFGIFIFFLINSNVLIRTDFIDDQNNGSNSLISNSMHQECFLFVCAFIVGFSERWSTDLLNKAESQLVKIPTEETK